jgi:hypothetical protein
VEVAVDSQAVIAAIWGAVLGSTVCRLSSRREWLTASGVLAIGVAVLLPILTTGNRSRAEHTTIFVVMLSTTVYFLATVVIRQRGRHERRKWRG